MRSRHFHADRGGGRGWTLIELLGVLSLLAVLAAVTVPLLMRELDGLARRREATELARFSAAAGQGIRRHRQIPDAAGWAELVAAETGQREADVRTNARGGRRMWIADPRLRIGPSPGATLPFHQTSAGSMEPVRPRVVLVSSLGEPLPAAVNDEVASSSEGFDAIWEAPSGAVPSGWLWAGHADDLFVERIQLHALFVPVVLNQSPHAPFGGFGLDGGGTNEAPAGVFQTWYLQGTLLRLHGPDDELQVSSVLQDPMSIAFERGGWRTRLSLRTTMGHWTGSGVDEAADRFLAAPGNPAAMGSGSLVSHSSVLLGISNFLATYCEWSRDGFSRGGTTEASVQDSIHRMDSTSATLLLPP